MHAGSLESTREAKSINNSSYAQLITIARTNSVKTFPTKLFAPDLLQNSRNARHQKKKDFHWLVANTNRQSTSLKESPFPQTDGENLLLYSLKIIETRQKLTRKRIEEDSSHCLKIYRSTPLRRRKSTGRDSRCFAQEN